MMAVFIDPPMWPAYGRIFSHLVSTVSYDELHHFAAGAGLAARAFDRDHYDVPDSYYDELVAAGAIPVSPRELLSQLVGAGLRRPKHLFAH